MVMESVYPNIPSNEISNADEFSFHMTIVMITTVIYLEISFDSILLFCIINFNQDN